MAMGAAGYQQELLEKRKILQWLLERWPAQGIFLPGGESAAFGDRQECGREAGAGSRPRPSGKGKAIRAAALLQAEADRQGICLKLRRKQGKKKN